MRSGIADLLDPMGVTSSRQRTDPPPTPANDPTAMDVGHVWLFGAPLPASIAARTVADVLTHRGPSPLPSSRVQI
jgi:hypothetical protein